MEIDCHTVHDQVKNGSYGLCTSLVLISMQISSPKLCIRDHSTLYLLRCLLQISLLHKLVPFQRLEGSVLVNIELVERGEDHYRRTKGFKTGDLAIDTEFLNQTETIASDEIDLDTGALTKFILQIYA